MDLLFRKNRQTPSESPQQVQEQSSKDTPKPPNAPSGPAQAVLAARASPYFGEDVDDKIEGTGCSKEYGILQDCLDDTDKDWRKCQKQLRSFQQCCHHNSVAGA
ncbi:hypothetical protein cyc_05585 [Cyclospora cayetanensis]|uniref:CHCH domain-containing protein n=1 Tax=Cyclospora cayetanensis TaxID=88456 RepID=A0A1D3D193_9EIME|nr:hypothetical protein cyc_05585 [Cyclospora cayetanensis]